MRKNKKIRRSVMFFVLCGIFLMGCGERTTDSISESEQISKIFGQSKEQTMNDSQLKSAESKDISKLDMIDSALASAVASLMITEDGGFEFGSPASDSEQKIQQEIEETIGTEDVEFQSVALSGCGIWLSYSPEKNRMITYASKDGENVATFQKTITNTIQPEELDSEDWEKAALVSN